MSTNDIAEEIVFVCRRLYEKGLIAGADGNVSARDPASGHILITPSGVHKGFLKKDELLLLNADGAVLKGKGRPSSELAVHLEIYRADSSANAVVHTHAPWAMALSLSGRGLLPHSMIEAEMLLGRVVEVPFYLPGSQELADAVVLAIKNGPVQLLAHHGAISRGATLRQAFELMECLEHNARIQALAHLLGGARAVPIFQGNPH